MWFLNKIIMYVVDSKHLLLINMLIMIKCVFVFVLDAVTMFTRTCSVKELELSITKSTSVSVLMRVFSWKGLETLSLVIFGCTITVSHYASFSNVYVIIMKQVTVY